MAKRSGIKTKKANQGKLRKAAGAKKGSKVSTSKLQALKKSKNPKTRQRAQFAINARKWRKKGKKKS